MSLSAFWERLKPGSRSRLISIASRARSAASLIRREGSASSKCFGTLCSQMVSCMNTKLIAFRGGASWGYNTGSSEAQEDRRESEQIKYSHPNVMAWLTSGEIIFGEFGE